MKPVLPSLLDSTMYTMPPPEAVAFGPHVEMQIVHVRVGVVAVGGGVYVRAIELFDRLIASSFRPPGTAYGILGACDSLMAGRPVSRTQSVSSGVIYRACTEMKVLGSLPPNWIGCHC
jgi:hypothetical protein